MIDGATKIDARAVRRYESMVPKMRANFSPLETTKPTLRIWSPANESTMPAIETPAKSKTKQDAESAGGLSSSMSLSAFYRSWVRPIYLDSGGAAKRNIAQYNETVLMWAAYTGNPSIEAIDESTCADFLAGLRRRKGRGGRQLANNTIIKHRAAIQKTLDLAGPRTRANDQAATRCGLFGIDEFGAPREAPLIPRIKKQHSLPTGGWTMREIAHWLDCAESWKYPANLQGIDAGVFWPALIRFVYNTGLRAATVLHIRRDMIQRGWLIVPRELMKGGRRDHRVWLNKYAREAVAQLTTANAKIVPWHSKTGYFYASFRRQFKDVFSAERRAEIGKPFHGLRARMLTNLWENTPGIAKMVASHRADVTLDHYVGGSAMRKALDKLPQPKRRRTTASDDMRQLTFFD